jgi:hypothetical protein
MQSMIVSGLIFMKLCDWQNFTKNFYTEIHENPTDDLVADVTSQTDGRTDSRTWSPNKAFFCIS